MEASGNLSAIFPGGFRPEATRPKENPAEAFRRVLENASFQVDAIEADTVKPVRVRTTDDKGREKSGWYFFWMGESAHAVFGDWRAGWKQSWSHRDDRELDEQTRAAMRAQAERAQARAQAERERLQAAAAVRAQEIVARAKPASAEHPYLKAKGVQPHGILQYGSRLLIPMVDDVGAITSAQLITADGKKRFLPDGKKQGCFFLIGTPTDSILIAEGFATAATLQEATGLCAAVAWDAGNLEHVARALRRRYPSARIVIGADNDQWKPQAGNVGIDKAKAACEAVPNCFYVAPTFTKLETKPTDWNDLAHLEGIEAIRAQLTSVLPATKRERTPIRASSWADQEVPKPQWLLENLIPMRQTTALYGDGGVGKTLLVQQLATCVVSGREFLGLPVRQGPVLGIFCEDSADILHERQDRINRMLGVSYRDLANFAVLADDGDDNLLMTFPQRDSAAGVLTPFWHRVATLAADIKPAIIIVDTAADTFGGNENIRAQVRNYIQGALRRLAYQFDCAVVVCAHPSAAGLSSGSGTGGSTAWNASVRSRLYFTRDTDTDRLILQHAKSNRGARQDDLQLVWCEGAFVPYVPGVSNLPAIEQAADREFLSVLRELLDRGIRVSDAVRGGRYAPRVILKVLQQRGRPSKLPLLEASMERLFEHKAIRIKHDERNNARWIVMVEQNQPLTTTAAENNAKDQ